MCSGSGSVANAEEESVASSSIERKSESRESVSIGGRFQSEVRSAGSSLAKARLSFWIESYVEQ